MTTIDSCEGCVYSKNTETMCDMCVDRNYYINEDMSVLSGLTEEAVQEMFDFMYASGFRPTVVDEDDTSFLGFNDYTSYLELQLNKMTKLLIDTLKLHFGIEEK